MCWRYCGRLVIANMFRYMIGYTRVGHPMRNLQKTYPARSRLCNIRYNHQPYLQRRGVRCAINPFRTAVPFRGQITSSLSGLSLKRDCVLKGLIIIIQHGAKNHISLQCFQVRWVLVTMLPRRTAESWRSRRVPVPTYSSRNTGVGQSTSPSF